MTMCITIALTYSHNLCFCQYTFCTQNKVMCILRPMLYVCTLMHNMVTYMHTLIITMQVALHQMKSRIPMHGKCTSKLKEGIQGCHEKYRDKTGMGEFTQCMQSVCRYIMEGFKASMCTWATSHKASLFV